MLWMAVSGEPSPQFGNDIFAANATGGRPLAGLFDLAAYTAAGTIDNLRFVRLVGVLGVVGVGVLLHWALVRSRIAPRVAAFIAILVCSLPAFQVYAAWTIENSMPYAMLLAAGGSLLVVSAVDGRRDRFLDRLVGGCALFVAALLTYQPAAMYFWVFLAVALIGATRDSRRAMRLVVAHLGVAAGAFVVTFVATKLFVHALGDAGTGGHRTELTHDVIGKARWFVEQPLYQALNLFKLTPSPLLTASWRSWPWSAIVTWLVLNADRPLFLIAVALVLVPLAYLPNLVVPDDFPPFRTQGALSSLLALYVCLGALGLWLTVRGWLRARFDDCGRQGGGDRSHYGLGCLRRHERAPCRDARADAHRRPSGDGAAADQKSGQSPAGRSRPRRLRPHGLAWRADHERRLRRVRPPELCAPVGPRACGRPHPSRAAAATGEGAVPGC